VLRHDATPMTLRFWFIHDMDTCRCTGLKLGRRSETGKRKESNARIWWEKRRKKSTPKFRALQTCPPLGHRCRRLARQPTRRRLLHGHGCPVSSFCDEEGGGTNPDAAPPPRGEDVVEFAAAGRADGRRCCCRAAGGRSKAGRNTRGSITRSTRLVSSSARLGSF
jgi:hypothetical protein